jgi:hypothetical protein
MPNSNSPTGLVPIGTMSGADYHGKLRRVAFLTGDSTATFIGDLIKLAGSASPDGTAVAVAQAAAGNAAVGVLVSLDPLNPSTLGESALSTANYRRASTLRYGYAAFGADVLYSIQEDSVGNAMPVTDASLNANVIVGAGNTITGLSGMELDSTSAADTNTLQLRIHGIDTTLGNGLGDYCRWIVSINLNQDLITTGVAA